MSPRLSDLFLRSQSDERLLELVRAGHDRAFTTIVERYRRPLYLFARRLNSGGNAEDVVQQAFLAAFSALRAGAEVRHLRGWLHQIVRNAAVSTAARAPQEAVSSPLVGAAGADDRGDAHLVAVSALEEVSRLPERQRDALIATALQGRSRSDVARSMGLSEGAVRQLVHRARATVRQGLTALTPYPLAQWLSAGGAPTADRVCELASGAGAAGMAGIALKLSAVAASGVIAAAIATSHHAARRQAPAPRVLASVPQIATAVPLQQVVMTAVPARPVAPVVPAVARPRTPPVLERRHRRGRGEAGQSQGDGERRARTSARFVVVTRHNDGSDGDSGQGGAYGHRGGGDKGRGGTGDQGDGGGGGDRGGGGGQTGRSGDQTGSSGDHGGNGGNGGGAQMGDD